MTVTESLARKARLFNGRLLCAVGLIAVSQFNFGFDQTAYSTTQAMDAFEAQFGHYDDDKEKNVIEPYFLSLLNSLPYVGFVIGMMAGSYISSRWGRRMCMFVMSCYALCTAAITVSSKSRGQILTARVLNYGYVGMELAVVPIFQSEIVPKEVRGFIVGTYQLMLYFGGLIMSLICRGTSELEGNKQWQIPFGLFFVIPTIVATLIWFIPESPRWLLLKGREEEAQASLKLLRHGRFTKEEIFEELEALRIMLHEQDDKGVYSELWKGVNLKRTLITIGTNFFLHITGQIFASKYGAVYIKSLESLNPFTMVTVNQVCNLVAVVIAMATVDRWGRRPLLMLGGLIQVAGLFTMAGLGVPATVTPAMQKGIISCITIFGFGFSIGWAPVSHILSAEIPTSRLRDMTYRTASAVNIFIQ